MGYIRNKINSKKFFFFTKSKLLACLTVFLISSIVPFIFTSNYAVAQEADLPVERTYDFVLIIDESGSMRENDPQNMRKDAAKLFFHLAEIFNKGNRILVSGFGSTTNIYLDMVDISGNEKEISTAINSIKSNQSLTDMKGALKAVKDILDKRSQQKETIVIFLTDGSLTLNDIPPEADSGEERDREQEKPKRPSEGESPVDTNKDNTASGISDTNKYLDNVMDESAEGYEDNDRDEDKDRDRDENEDTDENADKPAENVDYLKNYKEELLNLCSEYKKAGITINPIAFTKEADINILQQMAYITEGSCYQPQKDTDLRQSFFEILKDLSDRFIKVEDQVLPGSLTGNFKVSDDLQSLFVIGFKNKFNSNPAVSLTNPEGKNAGYQSYVDEDIFKIARVTELTEGDWKYDISGDAIFVYDITDISVIKPEYVSYLTGSTVPIEIRLNDAGISSNDYEISAEVKDQKGEITQLSDRDFIGDGQTFLAYFSGTSKQGYYDIDFMIKHLPTDSATGKRLSFKVVDLPVRISLVEPSMESYELGQDIKVIVRFEEIQPVEGTANDTGYLLTFNVANSQGYVIRDAILMDNGTDADEQAGDGLYSGYFKNTLFEDKYSIDIFISENKTNAVPVFTGLNADFELKENPDTDTADTESLNSTETEDSAFSEENSGKNIDWSYKTFKVPIILASVLFAGSIILAAIVILILYFLYLKPGKK